MSHQRWVEIAGIGIKGGILPCIWDHQIYHQTIASYGEESHSSRHGFIISYKVDQVEVILSYSENSNMGFISLLTFLVVVIVGVGYYIEQQGEWQWCEK